MSQQPTQLEAFQAFTQFHTPAALERISEHLGAKRYVTSDYAQSTQNQLKEIDPVLAIDFQPVVSLLEDKSDSTSASELLGLDAGSSDKEVARFSKFGLRMGEFLHQQSVAIASDPAVAKPVKALLGHVVDLARVADFPELEDTCKSLYAQMSEASLAVAKA